MWRGRRRRLSSHEFYAIRKVSIMRILARPIEVISYTDNNGDIRPLRFRLQVDDEPLKVIKVDKVIIKETEKLAGNTMLIFKCQSFIDNVEKLFELRYEIKTCKWVLFKI